MMRLLSTANQKEGGGSVDKEAALAPTGHGVGRMAAPIPVPGQCYYCERTVALDVPML